MKLPTLYELASDFNDAAAKLADLDLPDEVIADTLEGLQYPVEQKATNVAVFLRNLEATAEQIKAAEGEMARRRKAIEARVERLRDYLRMNMERTGITKIESPYFTIAFRKNPPSVEVVDEKLIPAAYMRQPEPPPPSPDKPAILAALKAGQDVPGCRIKQGERLDIR